MLVSSRNRFENFDLKTPAAQRWALDSPDFF